MRWLLKKLGFRDKSVLLYAYLTRDLDLLLPIAKTLQKSGVDVKFLVGPIVAKNSPRVLATLKRENFAFELQGERSSLSLLAHASVLITAADTTAPAHKAGHRLVTWANRLGVETFTLQHGLENIGLTYYDKEYPADFVRFASKHILTWCDLKDLAPEVPQEIRQKCIPTGCPKVLSPDEIHSISIPHTGQKVIAVFENLHWTRYDDAYRERFLSDLEATAAAFPKWTFLVKPHHAGRWLTDRFQGRLPKSPNLIIANPKDPQWEPYTAPVLIKAADAVITTPSTTAFDAASLGKMAAVVSYGLNLSLYEPLPLLEESNDWMVFLEGLENSAALSQQVTRTQGFRNKVSLPGDGAGRMTDSILRVL